MEPLKDVDLELHAGEVVAPIARGQCRAAGRVDIDPHKDLELTDWAGVDTFASDFVARGRRRLSGAPTVRPAFASAATKSREPSQAVQAPGRASVLRGQATHAAVRRALSALAVRS